MKILIHIPNSCVKETSYCMTDHLVTYFQKILVTTTMWTNSYWTRGARLCAGKESLGHTNLQINYLFQRRGICRFKTKSDGIKNEVDMKCYAMKRRPVILRKQPSLQDILEIFKTNLLDYTDRQYS